MGFIGWVCWFMVTHDMSLIPWTMVSCLNVGERNSKLFMVSISLHLANGTRCLKGISLWGFVR